MRFEEKFKKINLYKKESQIVFVLFTIGFLVRIIGFTNIPLGLNQDEASIGYEAFSLLKTGLDRNGVSFPIHFISWGNGQNALYAYLSMPFISIFGLNVFSVRIVNVIFGCISLIIFYSLFKLIFDRRKAIIALAILTICPWSIMSARWGLESNIFPALFLIGVYFLFKGIKLSQKFIPLSFFIFGVSLYSYGTSYLVVPLFILFLIIYLFKTIIIERRILIFSSMVFIITSLPIFLFILVNHLNLPQIEFFNITIPKLLSNRTSVIFNLFSKDVLTILPKNFLRLLNVLIVQSDGNLYNSIPYFGTIYAISLPFFGVGLLNVLIHKKYKTDTHHFIFCIWLSCSLILGVTSHININRLNIIFLPILYFVVHGIIIVSSAIKPQFKNSYKAVITSFYFLFFAFFIGYYFFFISEKMNENFRSGLGSAIQYAENLNKTDSIYISSNSVNMPYIYVCFYNKLNPDVFRKTVEFNKDNVPNGFCMVRKLGRYTFEAENESANSIHILNNHELEYKSHSFSILKKFENFSVMRYNNTNKK